MPTHAPMLTIRVLRGLLLCLLLAACSGGGGNSNSTPASSTPAASASDNVATVVIDGGPPEIPGVINALYVDVTVCAPDSSNCRTIDHVLVDTGSSGLRLIGSALGGALTLPSVNNGNGYSVGECTQFATGFTWGSVRYADVRIGGKTAHSLPIQIVSDPSFSASPPTDCSNTGTNWGTVAALGAKGILGVGLFAQNCGQACASRAIPGSYYACNAFGCTATTLAVSKQVTNPVVAFDSDNNGVLLSLPSVPDGGSSSLRGALIFGIGTRDNNQLGGASVYATDGYGNFTTTYKGRSLSASFIDSGSNALFFPDASLTACSISPDFFCPPSRMSLTAVNTGRYGSASSDVSFTIENLDRLPMTILAASIGGDAAALGSSNTFDWGLPFFFGRNVFVAIEGRNTPQGSGPYWAY